jgi:hypothetical protein
VADQPKKKNPNSVTRNADRKNGKASKTRPDGFFKRGTSYRGSHTRKTPPTDVQKVLLGGGMLRNVARRADGTDPLPWKLPQNVAVPFDRAQVEENKRLYPHLFTER